MLFISGKQFELFFSHFLVTGKMTEKSDRDRDMIG